MAKNQSKEPIEYDGRWCISDCRREGCDHKEKWDEQQTELEEEADFTGSSDELGYAPDR
ncbi:MAG: hypothetical protein WAV09_04300 [Minisyncoccia bacterium]